MKDARSKAAEDEYHRHRISPGQNPITAPIITGEEADMATTAINEMAIQDIGVDSTKTLPARPPIAQVVIEQDERVIV